jgi:ABC-type amino acid transport system permease subunit
VADRARSVGWREVLIVAAVAVAGVLAVEVISTLVPSIGDVFRGTPVIVALLIASTALVLWRVAARRPPEP